MHYRWSDGNLVLRCHVQPKSSRDEIVGLHDDRLKVRITAPPVEGKANRHLVAFLARAFGVSRSAVSIVEGDSGRRKVVSIRTPTRVPDEAQIAPA